MALKTLQSLSKKCSIPSRHQNYKLNGLSMERIANICCLKANYIFFSLILVYPNSIGNAVRGVKNIYIIVKMRVGIGELACFGAKTFFFLPF